jgi:hypothetical protein
MAAETGVRFRARVLLVRWNLHLLLLLLLVLL